MKKTLVFPARHRAISLELMNIRKKIETNREIALLNEEERTHIL